MKSFKTFVEEEERQPQFHRDNPGGDWLKYKQEDAEEGNFAHHKGIRGAVTATWRGLKMPPADLVKLPGARGEEEYRKPGQPKYDRMKQRVDENGWDHDPINSIYVAVNHKGDAYIGEGNHRSQVAHDTNVPWIWGEVRYFNGGERVPGPWHPDEVRKRYVK
jgi:hypothetical protein